MLRFSPPIEERKPQGTGILSWISLLSGGGAGKAVSGEEVDAIRMFFPFAFCVLERELSGLFFIVAGPNRPPARIRLYAAASEVSIAEGDIFGRMMDTVQERGCVIPFGAPCGITLTIDLDPRERLADMNERTKELEVASRSFATQVRYGC